jgi:hypothetical protein
MPFNPTTPTNFALNGCNDTTESGIASLRTNAPQYAGLVGGDYFDLTNSEAKMLSWTTPTGQAPVTGQPVGILYAGRYRRVQVDSAATANLVAQGYIGLMPAGEQPTANITTSYDKGIVGAKVVVFLNTVTPGNWCFVQELGFATVLFGSTIQKASPNTGDLIDMATGGVANDLTAQVYATTSLGLALSPPSPNTLGLVQLNLPVDQG